MWRTALPIALGVAYPLLIAVALTRFEPRGVALVVLALLGVRAIAGDRARAAALSRAVWPMALAIGAIVAAAAIRNDPTGLLLVPVAISLALLAGFGASLRRGPPLVERFARLQVPTLSLEEIAYCRRVTIVWCGFFVANAAIALGLALADRIVLWTVHTGAVSYVAIGSLFAVEFIVRHARFRRYVGHPTDPLLKRLFPPVETFDASLDTDPALACWAGHFPGEPILPGVLQLARAVEAHRRHGGIDAPLRRVEALRFERPIRPGDRVRIRLGRRFDEGKPIAHAFELASGEAVVSKGRLRFGGPVDELGRRPAPEGDAAPAAAIEDLLPHRPPMRWISGVVAAREEATRCLVDVEALARFLEVDAGADTSDVEAFHVLEWMAQAVCVHDTLARRRRDDPNAPPRIGWLLGTRRLALARPTISLAGRYVVDVASVWGGEGSLASVDAWVVDEADAVIAHARLACAIPEVGKAASLGA